MNRLFLKLTKTKMKLSIILTVLVLTATAINVKENSSFGGKRLLKAPRPGFGGRMSAKRFNKKPRLVKNTHQETAKFMPKTALNKMH